MIKKTVINFNGQLVSDISRLGFIYVMLTERVDKKDALIVLIRKYPSHSGDLYRITYDNRLGLHDDFRLVTEAWERSCANWDKYKKKGQTKVAYESSTMENRADWFYIPNSILIFNAWITKCTAEFDPNKLHISTSYAYPYGRLTVAGLMKHAQSSYMNDVTKVLA